MGGCIRSPRFASHPHHGRALWSIVLVSNRGHGPAESVPSRCSGVPARVCLRPPLHRRGCSHRPLLACVPFGVCKCVLIPRTICMRIYYIAFTGHWLHICIYFAAFTYVYTHISSGVPNVGHQYWSWQHYEFILLKYTHTIHPPTHPPPTHTYIHKYAYIYIYTCVCLYTCV